MYDTDPGDTAMKRTTAIASALLVAGLTFLVASALLERLPSFGDSACPAAGSEAPDGATASGGTLGWTRQAAPAADGGVPAPEGRSATDAPGRPQPENWLLDLPSGVAAQPRKLPGTEKRDLAAAAPDGQQKAAPAGADGALPPAGGRKSGGGNGDPQRTGCRQPTAAEKAWMKANLVDEKVVKPNAFGLKRINEWRKKQGLKPVTLEQVAQSRAARAGLAGGSTGKTSAPAGLISPAAVIDNSQLQCFPPIRTQSPLNSCACFSTTYYTMTYMVARSRGWDVTGTENTNKFSPKWTYNMINGGSDDGSWITTAYSVMQSNGCATWSEFAYDSNYREWCLDGDVWLNALSYRMSTSGSISNLNTDAGISNLKDKLNDGYILNFATHVYDWTYDQSVDNPDSSADDAYVGEDVCYTQGGSAEDSGHAMTIVGYNDHIWVDLDEDGERDANEVGAFRIANSWGDWWKEGGFCWYLYSAVKEDQGGKDFANWWYNQAYFIEARASYQPKMVARFTVNHGVREQMVLRAGIGNVGDGTPSTIFPPVGSGGAFIYSGGAWAFDGTSTACDGEFCLDFTDICPAVGVNKRWFLRFFDASNDGNAGVIKSLTLYNATRGETVGTVVMGTDDDNYEPDSGSANGGYAYAWIDGSYQDGLNTAPSISNIVNQSTTEDTAKGPISFTVSDAETAAGDLTLTGTSDNQGLVADSSIVFGGSGGSRTVTLTPEANAYGTATITVTVTDGGGLTDQDSFDLMVTAQNDDPVISTYDPSTPHSMEAGTSQVFEIWPHDDDGDTLTYSWKLDGGNIAESDTTYEYGPMPGDEGAHTIQVTVSDGKGGTDSHTWDVTVNGNLPYISCSVSSLSPSVKEGGDAAQQTFTVANTGAGTMSFTVGDNETWLSCSPTSGSSTGGATTLITVTYTTSALDVGTYNATITVTDTSPGTAGNSPLEIPVTLTVKKKSSGGGGGGGCSLAAGADAAGGLLPYLGLALAWLLGRRRRR